MTSELFSNESLLEAQERNETVVDKTIGRTSGSALMDFLGQGLWKFTDEALFQVPGAHDAYLEGTQGDLAHTWEEMLTPEGAEGEYHELSPAGKAGAIIGGGLGMIPQFMAGGTATKHGIKGAVGLGGKLITKKLDPANLVRKQSVKELIETSGEYASKNVSQDIIDKSMTNKNITEIVDEAYDLTSAASVNQKVESLLDAELLDVALKTEMTEKVVKTLGIVDNELATAVSNNAIEIVTRNSPQNAARLMDILVGKLPGVNRSPFMSRIMGAMAYDAVIGVNMAAIHAAQNAAFKRFYGVEKDDMGEWKYTGDFGVDGNWGSGFKGFVSDWWSHAPTEAFFFSLIGPAKFIKGGTTASNMGRLGSIFKNRFHARNSKINNMTNEQLRTRIHGIDALSGGGLNSQMGIKWNTRSARWWLNATDDASTPILKDYLRDIRGTFLTRAVPYWAKEFGKDMMQSLPRMAAGVFAMNSHSLYDSFSQNGFSANSLMGAFGGSGSEIASNIFVAAYFTRKPHSFHMKINQKNLNFIQRRFEYGKVGEWIGGAENFKANQLRKYVGGLKTFGVDIKGLGEVVAKYGEPVARGGANSEALRKTLDSTPEFEALRRLSEAYEKSDKVGADLDTSFWKYVADQIKEGKLTEADARILGDKLIVAKKIIEKYDSNSSKPFNIEQLNAMEAYQLVEAVSNTRFDGKVLSKHNVVPELNDFMQRSFGKAANIPQDIKKQFIEEVYRALGLEGAYTIEEGRIIGPDLKNIDLGGEVNTAFRTIYENGIKQNWIDPNSPKIDLPQPEAKNVRTAQAAFDQANERLMNHTHAPGWKGNIEVDRNILTHWSWDQQYYNAQNMANKFSAYQVLTNGKDHGLDVGRVNQFKKGVENLIQFKEIPSIDKTSPEGERSYGELSAFVETMHSIMVDLYPNMKNSGGRKLTQKEASELYNLSKELFGDMLTNPEAIRDFKGYAFTKGLERLGLTDFAAGINVAGSIAELIKNPEFNTSLAGERIEFPDITTMKAHLDMLKASKKIDPETHKQLTNHYQLLYDRIVDSNFNINFVKGGSEITPDAWIKGLQKSLTVGEIAMQEFTVSKLTETYSFLEGAIEKNKTLLDLIKLGELEPNDTRMKNSAELIAQLGSERKALTQLTIQIKQALEQGDPYKLRAFGKKQVEIMDLLNAIDNNPLNTKRIDYAKEILNLTADAKNIAHVKALNETSLKEMIVEQLRANKIPDKDYQEHILRITSSQFANKYNIRTSEVDDIFSIYKQSKLEAKEVIQLGRDLLGEFYDNAANIQNPALRLRVQNMVSTLNNFSRQLNFDATTPEGRQNFQKFIVEPLRLRMEAESSLMRSEVRPDPISIDTDLHQITTNLFSKVEVTTLKVDQKSKLLLQDTKMMGDVKNRGLMGILNLLDPMQTSIYVLEKSGVDSKGKFIGDVTGKNLNDINSDLLSGDYRIESVRGKSEYLRKNNPQLIENINRNISISGREQYKIIPINESTSLVVRVDKYNGSIHQNIQTEFRGKNTLANDPGGELYRKIEAIYDGDLSTNSAKAINSLLTRVREARTPEDIVEAVKLTRAVLNMPAFLKDIITDNQVHLDHDIVRDLYKRDKLNETKNGYIPTNENRIRTANLFEQSETNLFRNIYRQIETDLVAQGELGWLKPDANGNFRKLKTLSIDDTADLYDVNGKKVGNIFDSLDRATVELTEQRRNNQITKEEYDYNIELIREGRKSIVDADMFVAFRPYLAMMGMMGIHPDMLRIDSSNNVTGFKAGAIKPTITYTDIIFDRSNPNYGKVQQWFGKTAFKYNPILNGIMTELGIDALTFKSANKINQLKRKAGDSYESQFAEIVGKDTSTDASSFSQTWEAFISTRDANNNLINLKNTNKIVEIPLEALSLRTIAKAHADGVLVGQNAGVHMTANNGIADWIGVDAKIENLQTQLTRQYSDIYYRTELAKHVLGARAEAGDMSVANSAITNILERNGLIIEPWAQRQVTDALVNYNLNGGNIASGFVKDGSLDVMTADMGELKITVRSTIDGRPVVKRFGEFVPSYNGSQKRFVKPGSELNGVQNVLIQNVKYNVNGKTREADGFLITLDGEVFLHVEGRYIGKNGNLRDIDTSERTVHRNDKGKDISDSVRLENKKAYDAAVRKEETIYNLKDGNGHLLINESTTLNTAAHTIAPMGVSIGMLNLRQPRNMEGDIVISKMAKNKNNGEFYTDIESGNISRMNYVDAIKPQDADFDFDKSFNYVAAPGKFWGETNRLAGHITGATQAEINRLFNPAVDANASKFAKIIASILQVDTSHDSVIAEVNKARGLFVKMHQTVTYLSNIYKNKPDILTFKTDQMIEGSQRNLIVRLNNKGKYHSTVENISLLAKEFIDIYGQNLPAGHRLARLQSEQNNILFGRDGIFELGYRSQKNLDVFVPFKELNVANYSHVVDALRTKLVDPINVYLKYNQGMTTDPSGYQSGAKLVNYADAYEHLVYRTLDPRKAQQGIDQRIDFGEGVITALDYFNSTRNTYDVAMRSLYGVHKKNVALKKSHFGEAKTEAKEMLDYFEQGYVGDASTYKEQYNKWFNVALREYVKDEARSIKLEELHHKKVALEIELERKKAFQKGDQDSIEIRQLEEKISRIDEAIQTSEAALSYSFLPQAGTDNVVNIKYRIDSNTYTNNLRSPEVIIDAKGNIKEVILPGKRNQNTLYPGEKRIENGRRFEISDGQEQKGLRILNQAFGDLPVIIREDGSRRRFSIDETGYINRDYHRLTAQIRELRLQYPNDPTGNRKFSLEREQQIWEFLFNDAFKAGKDADYRKAMILRLIVPQQSNKIVSIRSINQGQGKQNVYDYIYKQNYLAESTISLLSKIASGERIGDKKFAKEILDDINKLKNATYIAVENPNIDLTQLKLKLFTEPASINGYMTSKSWLSQDVFERRNSSDKMEKDAAEILIRSTTENIDPALIYKASKVMESKGIPIDKQWGRQNWVGDGEGGVIDFGAKKIFVNEHDAMTRKDMGEKGGNRESSFQRAEDIMKCYNIK